MVNKAEILTHLEEDLDLSVNLYNIMNVSIEEWTTDSLESHLLMHPMKAPKLLKIYEKQKNPYGGNPFFLCEFRHNRVSKKMWMSGTVLYNVPAYNPFF
jgi:hypothetical protein